MLSKVKRLLIGRPRKSTALEDEKLNKLKALVPSCPRMRCPL